MFKRLLRKNWGISSPYLGGEDMLKENIPTMQTFPCDYCKFNVKGHCEGYPCSRPIKWKKDFVDYWTKRLATLKEDEIKYVKCPFNAPKVRRAMIMQIEQILGIKQEVKP